RVTWQKVRDRAMQEKAARDALEDEVKTLRRERDDAREQAANARRDLDRARGERPAAQPPPAPKPPPAVAAIRAAPAPAQPPNDPNSAFRPDGSPKSADELLRDARDPNRFR